MNKGKCIPVNWEQSQYAAELFAALEVVQSTDKNSALTIINTQDYVREPMNRHCTPGLSLVGNRQRVFYRSIREEKTRALTPRPSTTKMLKIVQKDVDDSFGRYVSDVDIWNTVYTKDILPRTAQFLWKGLHNAHRIGKYWTHIPECEDRAVCKDCNEIEDLEHILVECRTPGRETVWKAAESL
ncbi:hypothetical protein B0H13DRAFT_1916325 [Mycena leptocephala]|nr:hypothetical protein B0H13DRAFT_1916325 [Mycena leptocephala]